MVYNAFMALSFMVIVIYMNNGKSCAKAECMYCTLPEPGMNQAVN